MFFYTSCVVYIRSFAAQRLKNHYPVDSAIRPSCNRPQSSLERKKIFPEKIFK